MLITVNTSSYWEPLEVSVCSIQSYVAWWQTVICLADGNQFDMDEKQGSPADADKPARREIMQKLLQFDVFPFISPNSISPNF